MSIIFSITGFGLFGHSMKAPFILDMCPAIYSLMENLTTDTFEDGGKMEIDVHDLIGNVLDFDK